MEERFMREALELAARGRGRVAPNPMVGAVLVKDGRVVGRGWHRRFGGPHAEVEAIRAAGARTDGATLYVTMEPCCFHGKTPACTGAVELAGISEVVTATLDPNPRVAGRGLKLLRAAGIRTSVGMLAGDARRLNEAYFTFLQKKRPFVILKAALTLDGMMADCAGRSKWITGPEARRYGHQLREAADAILVGVNTVLSDNPSLTCRTLTGKQLVRVVLDARLRIKPECRLFKSPDPVVVFTASSNARRAETLWGKGVEIVRVGIDRKHLLRWPEILRELCRRQVTTLLIEGGATVAASALDAGIVDKVFAFHAPKILGPGRGLGKAMRTRELAGIIHLSHVEHECLGQDVLTSGYVHRIS